MVVVAALTFGAVLAVVVLALVALVLAAAAFLAAAVAAEVEPTDNFLTLSGWLMTLAALAVVVVVQYHLPSASAQLCPSGALAYESDWLITFPAGSSNLVWPPLFERLRFVSTEKKAVKLLGGRVVPAAKE